MSAPGHRKLRNQLSYVRGQAEGVLGMVDTGASPAEIVVQIRAMRAGLERALSLAIESSARERLARELETRARACPGLCDYCEDLLAIVDQLDLRDIIREVA